MKDTIDIGKAYDTYSRRLYNVSLRITGNSADAEEIMHDTLLRWWRYRHKEEIRDLPGWLASICIRMSIDKLRERNRWNIFLEDYEDPVTEENAEEEGDYTVRIILKALSGLPDHYRTIVSLHLFEGYDYREIAQITEIKEGTIRSMYMRGRKLLAEALKDIRI